MMLLLGPHRGLAVGLGLGMVFLPLAIPVGWVGYSLCLSDRLEGRSKVILIVAYPVFQLIMTTATATLGYLALLITGRGL